MGPGWEKRRKKEDTEGKKLSSSLLKGREKNGPYQCLDSQGVKMSQLGMVANV
jgi:hypothetical protein